MYDILHVFCTEYSCAAPAIIAPIRENEERLCESFDNIQNPNLYSSKQCQNTNLYSGMYVGSVRIQICILVNSVRTQFVF